MLDWIETEKTLLPNWLTSRLRWKGRSDDFRRSVRNSAYNTADHLLLPLLWLACTPSFVHALGIDRYGIWMLINALVGTSGVMAFGLTDATIKFVSAARGNDDFTRIETVFSSSLAMYLVLGIATGVAGWLAAKPLVTTVFQVQPQDQGVAVAALRIGMIGVSIRFVDGVFQSLMQGFERYDLSARVNVVINGSTFLAQLLLAMNGFSLVVLVAVGVAFSLPGLIWRAAIARGTLVVGLRLWPRFDRETARQMLGYGFYSWLQGIGGLLLGQLDRLLIASLLGTTALGYYAVCLQLAQQIHVIVAKAAAFLFPLSSALIEGGQHARLRRAYWKGVTVTTVAATALGLPIFVLAHPILAKWMGSEFAGQATVLLQILVFAFTAYATTVVPYYYLNGTGYVRLSAISGLINGVLVGAATLVMLPKLGVIGAAFAKFATFPVSFVSRAILHFYALGDRRWYVGVLALLPLLLPFVVGLAVQRFWWNPGELGIAELLAAAVAVGTSGAMLAAIGARAVFQLGAKQGAQ